MTLALGCAATTYGAIWTDDSGTSNEALYLRRAAETVAESLERSQALFGQKAQAIELIWAVYNESSTEGWDGYGAAALSVETANRAINFIRALPDSLSLPEFSAEPDGSISLDWILSRNRTISISIGTNERLSYAWLDGAERGYAVGVFNDGVIPDRLLVAIRGILQSVPAGIRLA